jgi:hypothetical protein
MDVYVGAEALTLEKKGDGRTEQGKAAQEPT